MVNTRDTSGAQTAIATTRALRRLFRFAHAEGMDALRRKDYAAMATIIRKERELVEAQRVLIDEERARLKQAPASAPPTLKAPRR